MSKYIDEFKEKTMKGFPFGEYGDVETIKEAIRKAYIDIQPRTIKGHAEFDKPKEKTVDWLSGRLSEYFKKPKKAQDTYNSWHQKVCSDFVQFFNTTFEADVKFGKAQKLLNMTMKYFYCAWGKEKEEAFIYCHMPLDSYIIEWYRREIDSSQKTTWSNLDSNEYYMIVGKINDSNLKATPIQAEFEIWQQEKKSRQKKDTIASLKRTIKYVEEERPELKDEIDYLNELLGKISK